MGKSTISMAIFNSYVKLPEGIYSWPSSIFHRYFSSSDENSVENWELKPPDLAA